MDKEIVLTREEKAAISALHRVAKKWPPSLWLYSASGSLWVMRRPTEQVERTPNSFWEDDSKHAIEKVNIPNDGGDW